jgi:two-component system, response regulator PdtaR
MPENQNDRRGAGQPRILIVEDEGIVAWDLQTRLESFHYEVAGVASSGEQALALAAERKPDLVLMDIKLAGQLDGIEVAKRLSSIRRMPVVFLTAHSDRDLLDRAKATEPFAYLLKPYQETELKIAIEIALYKGEMERERAELMRKLEQALAEVKTLRGLIPICSWCRKVRSDQGFWLSVESYIEQNTRAGWTHGICPSCYEEQRAALIANPELALPDPEPMLPHEQENPS